MRVAIVDADMLGRKKHRFPNLVCMKLSGYHINSGDYVRLVLNYEELKQYFDKIYISKVFTDTVVPEWVLSLPNCECGGTGFYYDKAPALPDYIEHCKPDYSLYDEWIDIQVAAGVNLSNFREYKECSIGFMTRGCFRKCSFCVNKNYDKVFEHSPLQEFLDPNRKKICLLDDNFFGCPNWRSLLQQLKDTGKPFKFKQGLDERLLTKEKCEELFTSKYDGDYIFAFDNIEDKDIIESKLQLIRSVTDSRHIKFYVFCAFNHKDPDNYSEEFWIKDIADLFERIKILFKYKCYPYIMRYKDWEQSPLRGMYIAIAGWCNQPSFVKKATLRQFGYLKYDDGNKAINRYLKSFEGKYPKIAKQYYDMRFEEL